MRFMIKTGHHLLRSNKHHHLPLLSFYSSRFFGTILNQSLIKSSNSSEKYSPSLLLGLPISNVDDVQKLAIDSIQKAKKISDSLKSSLCPSLNSLEDVLFQFDKISNEVCKIADWAECIRNVHPDKKMRQACTSAHSSIALYVEELNSDPLLYSKLKMISMPKQLILPDSKAAAESLLLDFEGSGVHLGSNSSNYIELYKKIILNSDKFSYNCLNAHHTSFTIEKQFTLLDSILTSRKKLASLVGFDHFSDYVLNRTMAGSSLNVLNFLNQLIEKSLSSRTVTSVFAFKESNGKNNGIPENFSPNSMFIPFIEMIDAFSELMEDLFGITFSIDCDQHEYTWSSEISRILVKNSSHQVLGVFYLDLLCRTYKPDFSCHYTLTGKKTGIVQQLPSVYLSLNIPLKFQNGLLYTSFDGARVFFHEMGHCLHSIFYDGRYQHLSGTRCSTDLAEIPSLLFEKFLTDHNILNRIINKTFSTRKSLPIIDENSTDGILNTSIDSMIDLSLHSFSGTCAINSINIIRDTLSSFGFSIDEHILNSYAFFAHFIHYPSKYYSYLWSEGCAKLIWQELFQKKAFNSSAGKIFREQFLSKGAIYSGSELMYRTLGHDVTTQNIVSCLF